MKPLEEILLPLFAAKRKFYGTACQIVVCGSIVPDPLQTLEPVATPTGPAVRERELSQLAAGGRTAESAVISKRFGLAMRCGLRQTALRTTGQPT
jgi:hypothetical protein